MNSRIMQMLLLGVVVLAVAACGRKNPLGTGPGTGLRDRAGEDGTGGVTGEAGTDGLAGMFAPGFPMSGTTGGSPTPGMMTPGTGGMPAGPGMPVPMGTGGGFPMGGTTGGIGSTAGVGSTPGTGGTGGIGGMDPGVVCSSDGWCCYPDGLCCHDRVGCQYVPGAPGNPPTTDEPWDPPIELGEPGWQDSSEPLCTGQYNWVPSYSVWADSRGVFALVDSGSYYYGPRSCADGDEDCHLRTVFINRGTGWEPYFERDPEERYFQPGETRLTGVENGSLFVYGYVEDPTGPCGLSSITTDGQRICEPVWGVEHVFVVNETLAYGVLEGGLVRFDGEDWGPLPTVVQNVGDIARVWATPDKLFATAHSPGKIYTLTGGTLAVEDTRTLRHMTSIWGFAEDDVWAGAENGTLLHSDGTGWTEVAWPRTQMCTYESPIMNMWGAEGVLYFSTENRIGRMVDGEVETLAEWPCDGSGGKVFITSIWGRGPNEVFFSLLDQGFPQQECGTTFLLYFDGTEFHRF